MSQSNGGDGTSEAKGTSRDWKNKKIVFFTKCEVR